MANSHASTSYTVFPFSVFGNPDRMILVARYDNLGKGASGAAVECLNILLGADPIANLVV